MRKSQAACPGWQWPQCRAAETVTSRFKFAVTVARVTVQGSAGLAVTVSSDPLSDTRSGPPARQCWTGRPGAQARLSDRRHGAISPERSRVTVPGSQWPGWGDWPGPAKLAV